MKSPINLSDQELGEYADEHLAYELDMLRWSGSILHAYNVAELRGRPLNSALSQPMANALLESFAIHTRNLIDFLYLRNHYGRDRQSDIVIEDYLDGPALASALPPITELLENAKKKADKQVAHLASERLRYGVMDKSWFYTEIFRDIYSAFRSVVPHVEKSKIGLALSGLVSADLPPFVSVIGENLNAEDGSSVGISFLLGTS